jgi:dimethylhistidine N-methyltransferase
VVEFGSGSSVKTPLLLSAIAPSAYVPLDIAGDFLRASSAALAAKFPGLPVHPVEADFMRRVELPGDIAALPKLGFFPGSTIGNMIARTATDLLRSMRATLGEGAMLLIGMDLVKDEGTLLAAYDDAAGVTARFNRNLAVRVNRELDGDLPAGRLRHEARWNDAFARIEMHLVAEEDLAFTVSGERFTMRAGESIHTENSHKFTRRSGQQLLAAGGWEPRGRWTDAAGQFSLLLAEACAPRSAP